MAKRTERTTRTKPAKRPATIRAAAARIPKVASAKLPEARPPANRAEKSAERRAAIVEAAMDEFIARGYAATRLDDVAKRAGVAKGTLYLYFKDKETMFEELIRKFAELSNETAGEHFTPREVIRLMVNQIGRAHV